MHLVHIYIHVFLLQKSLRKSDLLSTIKFIKNVYMSNLAFFWSLGKSRFGKYNPCYLTILILLIKIIIFEILKMAIQGETIKSSFLKPDFLISNTRSVRMK